ncbi:MAG: type II secretion system protein GspM [Pseudomonadota bacterium]
MTQVLAWWQGRELREQWLIGILAALALIVVYSFLILGPAQSRAQRAKDDYDRAYAQALELLQQVTQIEAAAGSAASPQTRMSLQETIAAAQLPPATAIEERGGLMRLSFDDVDAQRLSSWIGRVTAQAGGQIESMQIQRSAASKVSAVIAVRQAR